jgi:hypothetical protein
MQPPPPLTPPSHGSPSLWWHIAPRALFAVWLVCFLVVGAYLLAPHLLTLPAPGTDDAELQRSVAQRRDGQHGRWLVLHVLDQDCPCSQRVLDHLLDGPPPDTAAERVVWIATSHDADRISAMRAHGFDVELVAPEQLDERYHLQAAPLMVVVDPDDRVHYVGGYTPRKQADDVRDRAILAALQRGERVAPLPTFGCAVGAALRTTIDPLGVRRWN